MSFAAKLIARPKDACRCWFCLRAEGLTPPRGQEDRYRDCLGVMYRTHDGSAASKKREEAA